MLVTGEYIPNDQETKRSDIYGEVTSNNSGYKTGGLSVKVFVRKWDKGVEITFDGAEWTNSTITASSAIYYKSRGLPIEDDLICCINFGATSSSNGKFAVTESVIRIQN